MSHDATAVSNTVKLARLQAKLAHADRGSMSYKLIVSKIKALGGNVSEGSSPAVIAKPKPVSSQTEKAIASNEPSAPVAQSVDAAQPSASSPAQSAKRKQLFFQYQALGSVEGILQRGESCFELLLPSQRRWAISRFLGKWPVHPLKTTSACGSVAIAAINLPISVNGTQENCKC